MPVILRSASEVKVESRMHRDVSPSDAVLLLGLALLGVGVVVRVIDAVAP
jgi:hypothetical protein